MISKAQDRDIVSLSNTAWHDILTGNVSSGVAIYEKVLDARPTLGDYMNLGIGRLLLSDFLGAEMSFRETQQFNVTFRAMNVFVGTSLYLQGKKTDAAASWVAEMQANQEHKITNADAGGARAPLLLWSICQGTDSPDYLHEAEKELRRLLPGNEGHWIQPLMRYALQEMSEVEVKESIRMLSNGSNVGRRMLAAQYYMTRPMDIREAQPSLTDSFANSPRFSISDPEYHLVRYELANSN